MQKIVHAFNLNRIYAGPVTLNDSDISPLEPGVFLIPGDCLEEAPPPIPNGQRARAVGGTWVLEDIPAPPPAPVAPPQVEAPAPVAINPASFLNLPPAPPETPETAQSRLMGAVQHYMDTMARGFGYDSIATAVTYAEEPAVPKFQQEGRAFRAWRSLVWARCYELQLEVMNLTRSVPDETQLIALLPQFNPNQEEQQG